MKYGRHCRYLTVLVLVLAITLIAGGCGKPEPAPTPAPAPAPAPKPAEPAKPAGPPTGGQITITIVGDPLFNPHHPRHYVESVMATRILFPGLTRLDDEMKPSPHLAKSWDVTPDGLTWTFKLQDKAVWHDGTPVTAEDVRFTFMDVVANPEQGSAARNNFRMVTDVEVVDDHTVKFHLASPSASLAACMSYNAGILPKHVLAGQDINNFDQFNKRNPIGSGPFKMKEYVSGQYVTLERFDDYFEGPPLLDFIHYKVLPDPNTQVAQLLSGEIDMMIVDNPANIPKLQAASHVAISPTPQVNYTYLAPNTTRAPFDDTLVRQAMMYAMDRNAMVTSIMKDYAQIANGPISPALTYYHNPDVKKYNYDPAKAKQLLDQAGWVAGSDGIRQKDGKKLTFMITVPRVHVYEQVGTLAQQYFKDVGIDAKFEALEFNLVTAERLIPRNYDMMGAWWVSPPDPDVLNYFHSDSAAQGNNVPMYSNAELDALLVQGREAADPEARRQIYFQIQEMLAEEVPYLYLWHPQEILANNTRVKGFPTISFRDALQHAEKFYVD